MFRWIVSDRHSQVSTTRHRGVLQQMKGLLHIGYDHLRTLLRRPGLSGMLLWRRIAARRDVTMAKTPSRHGTGWTSADVKQLKQLAKENTPTRVIALKIGRTPASVAQKASSEQISLKPTNQRPYNRRK